MPSSRKVYLIALWEEEVMTNNKLKVITLTINSSVGNCFPKSLCLNLFLRLL